MHKLKTRKRDRKSFLSLAKVSGISPYLNCMQGESGMNFTNAEVEPYLAVNPTTLGNRDGVNLIGVWQQDRWSNGGAHGLVAAYSFNRGKTWGRTTLPFSACAPKGLKFDRASDPWVSFGPDGTAYTSALTFNIGKDGRTITKTAIAAATSRDGGRTWRNLRIIKVDRQPLVNDKETITADSIRPGLAYVVWDRANDSTAPTWFSKTTDGGKSWSRPRIIFFPGENNGTIGNQIVVNPLTGTLYNFFNWIIKINKKDVFHIALQKSFNCGKTWSKVKIIARFQSVGVIDPNTGVPVRTGGDAIPEPAINPLTGRLYVVWQDSRFNGGKFDEVAISSSGDGGKTWSKPVRVNRATGKPAFTPSIAVNSAGVVGVSYYDFRTLTKKAKTLPTNYWFTVSANRGKTFAKEKHIAGPFNLLTAPFATPPFVPGFFIGDYQGLATIGRSFQLFFAKTNSGNLANRTDIFTTRVKPARNKY